MRINRTGNEARFFRPWRWRRFRHFYLTFPPKSPFCEKGDLHLWKIRSVPIWVRIFRSWRWRRFRHLCLTFPPKSPFCEKGDLRLREIRSVPFFGCAFFVRGGGGWFQPLIFPLLRKRLLDHWCIKKRAWILSRSFNFHLLIFNF